MLTKGKLITLVMIVILVPMYVMGSDGEDLLYIEDHLVVCMNEGYSIDLIHQQYGTEVMQHLPQLDIYLLRYTAGGDLYGVSTTINSMPEVKFCHPNYVVIPLQAVQTSIPISDNEGSGDCSLQRAATDLGLPDIPATVTGSGIKVAVIDGGVNDLHPYLTGFVTSGYDYIDHDEYAFDDRGGINSGHGTFIAGIIHLVAPEAEIVAYRVTDTAGFSTGYVVAEAVLAAVEDGCRVINLSMVMAMEHEALSEAIQYAVQHGVVVIAAAGNDQFFYEKYPAADENTIAVAAVDSVIALADFSCYGMHIDVCAPGTEVYSAHLDTGYAWWGGTSFAAPFVAGQAALLFGEDPTMTYDQIVPLITHTATSIDNINPDYAGLLGSGLINIAAALENLGCLCGDVDYSQGWDINDMTAMIDLLLNPEEIVGDMTFRADVDPFKGVDVGDLTYFSDYIYRGGPQPCLGRSTGDGIPGGLVDVGYVSGQVGPTDVMYNQSLTFDLTVENTAGLPFVALSNGFRVYSPDGALAEVQSFSIDEDMCEGLMIISPAPLNEYDPDGFGWYGFAMNGPILPAGFRDVAYSITLKPFSESDVGKTICLDTSSYAIGGSWKWQVDGLSNHIAQWEGPYCYTIVSPDFNPGDLNDDGSLDILDLTDMVDYLFKGEITAVVNTYALDINGNCIYGEISDLTRLVAYLFSGGSPPVYGCTAR